METHCITIHDSTWLVLKLFKDFRKCWNYTGIKYFKYKWRYPCAYHDCNRRSEWKTHAVLTSPLIREEVSPQLPAPTVITTQKSLIQIGKGTIIPHYTDYTMPAHNVFKYTVESDTNGPSRKFVCERSYLLPHIHHQNPCKYVNKLLSINMARKWNINTLLISWCSQIY
jgi:hypothetical protein